MEKHLQNADNSSVDVVNYVEEINLSKESDNIISPAAIMPVSKTFSSSFAVIGNSKQFTLQLLQE